MRYLRIVLLALLLAMGTTSTTLADSPSPPRDYTIITRNGAYMFVMLAREQQDEYNQVGYTEQDEELRKKFKHSGLYLNDGSDQPLWTVDWYAFRVEVSSDGHHLVKWGPWPRDGAYGALAVAFYKDGAPIKAYTVQDLVKKPSTLPQSVSHYMWQGESSFDDEQGTLFLSTLNGEEYLFKLSTGVILESSVTTLLTPEAPEIPNSPAASVEPGQPTAPAASPATTAPTGPALRGRNAIIIAIALLIGLPGLAAVGWRLRLRARKRGD